MYRKSTTRRNYKSKRKSSKSPWYNRKYSALQLAAKAAKGVYYLKGLVNSELLINQTVASAAVNNSGTIIHLTGIEQNDTVNGRTGNSILLRQIHLRAHATIATAATTSRVKWAIIMDTQQRSDTSPSILDIYDPITVGTYTAPESFLNSANLGRYTILKSGTVKLDDANRLQQSITADIDLRHHVRYNGVASTDIQKGGIYLIFLSNETTDTVNIGYTFRLRYHDN